MGLGFVEAVIAWGCTLTKSIGDAAWGMGFLETLDFSFGSLVVRVWVFLWEASCGASVCKPFSVLILWHDGFLGVLLVGLSLYCIGFFESPRFHEGVYVGFVCCAGILISFLSSFQILLFL